MNIIYFHLITEHKEEGGVDLLRNVNGKTGSSSTHDSMLFSLLLNLSLV